MEFGFNQPIVRRQYGQCVIGESLLELAQKHGASAESASTYFCIEKHCYQQVRSDVFAALQYANIPLLGDCFVAKEEIASSRLSLCLCQYNPI